MLEYILGVLTGICLSLLAIMVGKKSEVWINQPLPEKAPGMAEIIKRENVIDEILK